MRYRRASWDADQVLRRETYDANPADPGAERDWVYDRALRLFQEKVSFDSDPLWRVTLFRASSNPDHHRLYLSLTLDHIIIDGRGAVKLARTLVADDISEHPKEDIAIYKGMGGEEIEGIPPYSFIASTIFSMLVIPRLPGFLQRWLGRIPAWPQKVARPPIDSPWKSSILDVPAGLMHKLKAAGKRHGIATLNPTLHTAWVLAIWTVFIGRRDDLSIRDCSVKDLRDVSRGDPYCLAGHATMFMWSTGSLTTQSRFWDLARSYGGVSADPQAAVDGFNMMKMLNLVKEKPTKPEECRYRAPDPAVLPAGDKRAHTLREEGALKKINSLCPYDGLSGIWSNLSYMALPVGATDMIFGVSGNDTGTAFNTCLVGHENGVRLQNAFSDGAAMTEEGVKKAEKIFVSILESIAAEEGKDWLVGELVKDA